MTYKQWYEKNVKGKPQVQVEEKKLKNMTSDRKQWQKYRTILKDKIPDSLDKFQDMKYNKTDTWNALKLSFRKTSNANTAFKSLSEPMQLKHVHKVLSEMGIDFENAKIKIERNPELIGKGYFGWTNPNMKEIQLYPDAFSSREELVKTLGHERIHLEQLRNWGPAKTNDEAVYYEKGPKISEDYWWNEYRRSINYDGRKSD